MWVEFARVAHLDGVVSTFHVWGNARHAQHGVSGRPHVARAQCMHVGSRLRRQRSEEVFDMSLGQQLLQHIGVGVCPRVAVLEWLLPFGPHV